MTRDRLRGLWQDSNGKAPVKLVLGTTVVALSVAMTSPEFRTNPMLVKTMGLMGNDMENVLPQSLERVTEALRGVSD